VAEFLSDGWLDDLEEAAGRASVPSGVELTVQQVVQDDAGEVAYAMVATGGRLSVRRGRVARSDLTFTLDRDTARAIHEGTLPAQAAFLDGRLRLVGDVVALNVAAASLAGVDDLFAACRA
jgi:putative sterol carrier protein